jgi:hypothetical protein
MAISRPMMMSATSTLARSRSTSTISAAATMSLSATGSRKAPKADIWFRRRASQPSSQSVIAARAKMAVAVRLMAMLGHPAVGQVEHRHEQRDQQDAQPGQGVGQVERHRLCYFD